MAETKKFRITNKMIENAYDWYREHPDHVENLITEAKNEVRPGSEDARSPNQWKPEHWKWMFRYLNIR